MMDTFPELRAMANAARAIGQDIAKTKDELERLVRMIIKDEIKDKIKVKKKIKDSEGKEREIETEEETTRQASIEDILVATYTLIFQDEKFRRYVPDKLVEQLMTAASALKDYEERDSKDYQERGDFDRYLSNIKGRIRSEIMMILKKAYPTWQSLVPDATSSMLEAMTLERKREHDNTMSNLYAKQHGRIDLRPPVD